MQDTTTPELVKLIHLNPYSPPPHQCIQSCCAQDVRVTLDKHWHQPATEQQQQQTGGAGDRGGREGAGVSNAGGVC